MKISWSFALAVTLVSGLIAGSYLSHPDRGPVLRGYKVSPQIDSALERPTELPQLPDVPESITRWTDEAAAERPALNLTLPEIEWESGSWQDGSRPYPDFFRPADDGRLNISGRLHWDESEEARSLPITETILGAEVELQFRLR